MKKISRIAGRSLLPAAFCVFLMISPALADIVTWSSTATSAEWNDSNNWVDGIVPTSADTAVISGGSSFYPLLADGTVSIGDLIVQADGSITVTSPASIEIFGDLNLESGGLFDLNGGVVMLTDSGQILSAGQFYWNGGEVKSMSEGVGFVWENSGEIRISAGGFPLLGDCDFQNENRFVLEGGVTLTVQDQSSTGTASFENASGGTIEGNGLILFAPFFPIPGAPNTRLVNNGTVSPGGDGAIGALEIIGDFVNNGVFQAEIAAPGGMPAFDSLTVFRDVELDFGGELVLDEELVAVALDGDFADGQMFPVLAYETRSGVFGDVSASPPTGFFFDPVEYGPMDSPGTVLLTIRSEGSEPTVASLSLTGPSTIDELLEESTTRLTVVLDPPAETAVVVNLSYGGDADASRYDAPASVTIPQGENAFEFPILATDNAVEDGLQNLRILLAEGVGYEIGEPAEAEIFIDDAAPPFSDLSLSVTPSGGGFIEAFAANGEGGGTEFACPETCEQTLLAGTSVSLTAVPASGYAFVRWEYPTEVAGLVSESGDQAFVSLGEDVSIAAVFVSETGPTLNIAIQPPGAGAVSGEYFLSIFDPETEEPVTETTSFSCPEECAVSVPAGASVSLAAAPAAGFDFSGWQGVDQASGAEAFLAMEETDRQVIAAFADLSPPPPPPPPPLPPVANFETAGFEGAETVEIVPGTELEFRDRSTGDGLFRWAWSVTDDETGAVVFDGFQRNPRVLFENPGTYSVRLATTGSGGSSVRTRTGHVRVVEKDAPSPAFSSSPGDEGCAPLAVTLTDMSQGEISRRLWLVDGENRGDASPLELTFDEPGTYEIKLRVIGMDGREYDSEPRILEVADCSDETDFTFEIEPFPDCRRVRFQAASRETILSQSWSFGDGSGSDQADPTHEYAEDGAYPVALAALLGNGETRTVVQTVVIDCAVEPGVVVADFEAQPTSGFVPLEVSFVDKSFAAGGIDGRAWDFTGDGVPDVFDETAPVFVYESAGTYTATLTVTGPDGTASVSRVIEARSPPTPSVPGAPRTLAPADGAFLDDPDIVLAGTIPWESGEGDAIETRWWFRSADKRCEFRDYRRTTFGGDVEYRPDGLVPGLQYVWRFGYRDPGTDETVWTDLRTFTIGTPENLYGPEIEPGSLLADYRMRTFNAWSVPPDIVALLSDFVGDYDPRFFRIGGWDPELGDYVEFSDELPVFPGRAYWFLAREGLTPEFSGVPVSREADVNVNLFFSETTQTGWNQIASPNDADYRWEDVELVAFEPTDDPNEFRRSFGPVPLSELPADNPYIELELWRFVEDTYVSMLPGEPEAVVLGGEGYWVAAKRDNICLVFPKAAQDDLNAEETMMVRTLRDFRRFAADQIGPRAATAQSAGPPPRPMGELEAYDGPSRADRVDGGGGGACFIESASR